MNDLDPQLSAKLKEYQTQLADDWENLKPTVDDTPEEIARKSRVLVINSMPRLIEKATLLALGADSESVSLSAVKFLYNIIVPPATRAPGEIDPLEKLMSELTKNDSTSPDPQED